MDVCLKNFKGPRGPLVNQEFIDVRAVNPGLNKRGVPPAGVVPNYDPWQMFTSLVLVGLGLGVGEAGRS